MDTIFAPATARGRAGVSVVRVSGPDAWHAAERLAGRVPTPRRATLLPLRDHDGELIDHGLVLVFEKGASFTGEPVVEFQVHGSIAVVERLLQTLAGIAGFRLAEPGEFTRRAMQNGRLDLSQVEGLADLIEAETEAQRRQALRVFSGALGKRVEGWRAHLVRAAALLEATIDFADEEVPEDVTPEVQELLRAVRDEVEAELANARVAERIRHGFEVAIVGRPNAGKSTLLNALAGREAAITSEIAGTTRDVIEVRMDLGGLPVTFLDTAGLRETSDEVEALGVERARARAEGADLRIFLLSAPGEVPDMPVEADDLVLLGKADLWPEAEGPSVSGTTGKGLAELVRAVEERLSREVTGSEIVVRARHQDAMATAISHLEKALGCLEEGSIGPEIVAEEVRGALNRLDSVIGRVGVEDILDEIFSSFCLGK
ncbi:MAG: tRNA uridine-5-carboxymethylaminomethyl(34) synthesis GTPase MnmE [Alphaproteobacteria bacterium]|nr:MAG: tRNA uridine-5-carboxymethylaminomethyl(34) synthesis GTPase MnmE [Alphaproteobacteria bacterium]